MSCAKSEKRIPKKNGFCDGCKKTGNLHKCDAEGCDATTHLYCALKGVVEKKDDPSKAWSCRLGNQKNDVKGIFDIEDPTLKDALESSFVKLEKISKRMAGDLVEQENEPEPETESKSNSAKKKKRGDRKKGSEEEGEKTKMLSEEEEAVIIGVNEEIKDKLRELIKNISHGNRSQGGEMSLQCKNHRLEELYCTCNLPYDEGKPMIACDCCSKLEML